jgi:prevent-host-death family protein
MTMVMTMVSTSVSKKRTVSCYCSIMPRGTMSASIKASEFKAKCLQLMDDVAASGQPVVITKNGVPVAELGPVGGGRRASLFGLHAGQLTLVGDILCPVGEGDWEVLQ